MDITPSSPPVDQLYFILLVSLYPQPTKERLPRCTIPGTEEDTIQVLFPHVTNSQISSHNIPLDPHQFCHAGEQTREDLRLCLCPSYCVRRRQKQHVESREQMPGEAPIIGFLAPLSAQQRTKIGYLDAELCWPMVGQPQQRQQQLKP